MLATPSAIVSPPLTARPLRCRACGAERAPAPIAICEKCLGPLEPLYDPGRPLPDQMTIGLRPPSMWRYHEWRAGGARWSFRSEEHTSELQSHHDLVCRLLLEKKKNRNNM